MGQAKNRGTLEDRIQQAKAAAAESEQKLWELQKVKDDEDDHREAAKIAAMSDEERDRYYTRKSNRGASALGLLGMAGIIGGMGLFSSGLVSGRRMGPIPGRYRR